MFAVGAADGAVRWATHVNACGERTACSPSMTAPSAVVPGAVFGGSMDGHFRAFARHLHFHLPHLLHQGFLVFLELPAFVFQFLVQGQ